MNLAARSLLLAALVGPVSCASDPADALVVREVTGSSASYHITFDDVPAPARQAFEHAVGIWSELIASDVTIKVRVHFGPLATRGATVPNGTRDFEAAPVANVWYPSALADALSGEDLQPGEVDMEIFYNEATRWYYGTDGQVPEGASDFVTVTMHEMAHGLGVFSLLTNRDGVGSYGLVVPPLPPLSFDVPELGGRSSAFDVFIQTEQGVSLMDTTAFANPSAALGRELARDRLYFAGPETVALNGGERPRINGPDTSHLRDANYARDPINGVMAPQLWLGHAFHALGPVATGMLRDVGWTIEAPSAVLQTD